MIVALDTRPLHNQSAGRGIGMYTQHLRTALTQIDGVEVVALSQGETPASVDLIHYPYYDLYFRTLPLRKPRPTVVTIHDVIPLVLAAQYPVGVRGKVNLYWQKLALNSVKAIITDSQTSCQDIIKYLKIPAHKVYVVPLAAQDGLTDRPDPEFVKQVQEKFNLPDHFVLYVGDINVNKNVPALVHACKLLNIPLVVAGKAAVSTKYNKNHPENQDLVQLQYHARKSDLVKLVGFVDVDELSVLYHLAAVYCQPSLYEGFGLPVLEAMKCGCPVVMTKKGSLAEIGGEAAVYVGTSPDKISQGIQFVTGLTDAQRQRLVQEGKKQAAKFSWEETAIKTYEVYEKVLGRE